MLQLLPGFKWRVFIPVFLLFISYVFGVAVDLLEGSQLYLRFSVILLVLTFLFVIKWKVRFDVLLIYVFTLLYFLLLYFLNHNSITLNFIYLTIIVCYLHILKVSQYELLLNSLVASMVVALLYIIYFFMGSGDLGEINIGGRVRYYFGFSNPNKVGVVSYSLIILTALYSFKNNNSFIFTILMTIPFFIIMVYSDSRTAIFSTVLFYLLVVTPFSIRLKKFLFLFPLIFLLLSLFVATLHDNDFANGLLSLRPIDYYDFLSTLTSMDYFIGANSDGFRVDNSYILALFSVGSIGFILISYLLYQTGKSKLDVFDLSFMISMFSYGVLEGVLVRVEFPLILYFYYLIVTCNRDLTWSNRLQSFKYVSL